MTTLKVGDRVRSRQPGHEYTGRIAKIDDATGVAEIHKDDPRGDFWHCKVVGEKIATAHGVWDDKSYLEKINDEMTEGGETIMNTMTDREKKELDKVTQSFRRLSWLNSDLTLTDSGSRALADYLFDQHKVELGKIAEQRIKEFEKESEKK